MDSRVARLMMDQRMVAKPSRGGRRGAGISVRTEARFG